MGLMKWKLLLVYARDYLFYATLITGLSYYVFFHTGIGALTILIWFKLLTSLLGVFVHQNRKSKELAFYLNNGLGKKQLMIITLALDLLFWIAGMITIVRLSL